MSRQTIPERPKDRGELHTGEQSDCEGGRNKKVESSGATVDERNGEE